MIERLHPGVFVSEVAFDATSIDGVSPSEHWYNTAQTPDRPALASGAPAPAWTQGNQSDPGIPLLQLFAFLSDALLSRSSLIPERHGCQHWGVVHGLGVRTAETSVAPGANVSSGLAVGPDGRQIARDCAVAAHFPKP
jgi:hypothetical protein